MLLPEEINRNVSDRENEGVDEKDHDRQQVEWVLNGGKKMHPGVTLTQVESILAHAIPEVEIFFPIEETSAGQNNNDSQKHQSY